MLLRRFTNYGLKEYARFIDRIRDGERLERPDDLLTSDETSVSVGLDIQVGYQKFENRFEFGQHLCSLLDETYLKDISNDTRLWDWLSLFYIDVICPPKANLSRTVGAQARYCLDPTNWKRYYRHLTASPWRITKIWIDDPQLAATVLMNVPSKSGDLYEQLASRLERITSRPVMEVAHRLYIDSETGKPKRGSGSKGLGSPRRFSDVLGQFERTYNIFKVSPDQLLSMLPAEFNRFKLENFDG